jgi:hypothetical protein
MRKSLHVATALVVGTITVGTASIAVASRSDDIRIGRPTVTRVHDDEDDDREDRARCLGTPSTSTTMPADQGVMSQTITVTIERTALLRVDRRGRITAAATNTGCRPQPGDRVYVIAPSGTYTEVTDVDLDEFDWKGSFRAIGRFERQSGKERLDDH